MPYTPELSLIPEQDGGYILMAVIGVPSIAYMAGQARAGAPPLTIVPPGAVAVVLPILSHAEGETNVSSRATVRHRLAGMHLEPGTMVHAFVTVDGVVQGHATVSVPSLEAAVHVFAQAASVAAPGSGNISVVDCLHVAVQTTPFPGNAKSPDQQLHELGIVDDQQVRKHRNKVAAEMQSRGASIDEDAVQSGPSVTIANCGHSIFQNQRS